MERRMNGYYYGFDPTGVDAIDLILHAVACAGKAYHHTDQWNEECSGYGECEGNSCTEWIQNAANKAALAMNQPTRTWTSAPSGEGYYWFKRKREQAIIVKVSRGGGDLYGTYSSDEDDEAHTFYVDPQNAHGQWFGPLDSPPQMEENRKMSQPPTRTWTSAPSEEGHYWFRGYANEPQEDWCIYQVWEEDGEMYSSHRDQPIKEMMSHYYPGGQWYGPLDSPPGGDSHE